MDADEYDCSDNKSWGLEVCSWSGFVVVVTPVLLGDDVDEDKMLR